MEATACGGAQESKNPITSVPDVAKSGGEDADRLTPGDAHRPDVSASGDPVESALARALTEASAAGRFDVVVRLATELEARRLARMGNVVALDATRRTARPRRGR
jgi:hypothetical protein